MDHVEADLFPKLQMTLKQVGPVCLAKKKNSNFETNADGWVKVRLICSSPLVEISMCGFKQIVFSYLSTLDRQSNYGNVVSVDRFYTRDEFLKKIATEKFVFALIVCF